MNLVVRSALPVQVWHQDAKKISLVKKMAAKDCNDDEFNVFVAVADVIEECSKTGSVVPSARHGVRVDLRCTGRLERIVLLVQRLGDGADPGVAEPHADNRWADGL